MNKEEILYFLSANGVEDKLFHKADEVRRKHCGDEVHIRGIIEFSNYCCRNCLYCGLRQENRRVSRYRMTADEIINLAGEMAWCGVKTLVLQSGDDFGVTQEMLSIVIRGIKRVNPEIAITLSVGERSFDDYKAWKDAGADRYLLKHETANPGLYHKLHPGQSLRKRLEILEYLKELGYQVGAGNIVGLPGQTLDDLVEDILLMKRLEVDMAGVGPFIPQRDTPLKNYPHGELNLSLKVLALTRIATRDAHLPATTALATLNPEEGQVLGLKAGANVIMPDFTPEDHRKDYVIYDDKARVSLEKAQRLILEAGRRISSTRGDSLKCNRPQKVLVSI